MSLWAVLTTGGTPVALNVDGLDEARARAQFDMRGKLLVPLARALRDFETVTPAGAIVEDAEALRVFLLGWVDREREARSAPLMTAGAAKLLAYDAKARELADWRALATDSLAALTQPQRAARFPFAVAEATSSGDPLPVVFNRIEAGIQRSRIALAAIEATASVAKDALRAAATPAALRAVIAATGWKAPA